MMILFVTGTCFLASVSAMIYTTKTRDKRSDFTNHFIELYCAFFACVSTVIFSLSLRIVLT